MEFGIASNTKAFVAAAMLKLAESNTISLNDSLHDWLPNYPNINPNITIRQLLNHTSGVQDPIFLSPWMDTIMAHPTRVFTPTEVLSWVGPPVFAAGTSWGYSNVNYILAGMVAESATGMHISQIIRDSILTPLNLDSTFYDVEEPVLGTIAHRWFNSIDYNDTSRVGLNTAGGAAGSLFSNSGDMVKWYRALFSGQLLSPASYAELTTVVPTGGAYTYGLGIENQTYFGHNTYQHGGSTWGYKSRMIYDPCMGAAVCGLVNSWPAGMDGLTLLLYRVVVNHVPGCPGTITGNASVCQGQNSVTYTVPPIAHAVSYVWTLPGGATGVSNTNSITVNYGAGAISGDITVRGNNTYGVGNFSTLHINVHPTYAFTENHSICNGDTYNWHGTNYSSANTYTANYATVNGCDSIYTLNLSVHTVDVSTAAMAATITASASGLVYQWLDCNSGNSVLAGETNQSFTATAIGDYAVMITDNGCIDTSSCISILSVGIQELNDNNITFYPNPFTTQLIIHFATEQKNTSIKITDVQGKEIKTISGINGKQVIIDKGETEDGIYFMHVINENGTVLNRKIVIQ